MASSSGKITYIEPNNIPARKAAKTNGSTKLDNITWNPEDLNISVDLQVVIPSRAYRPSDINFNEDKISNGKNIYQSILSGVNLKPNDKSIDMSYLTDDYTSISYQEIKNNHAGSKEMLGINSIHIDFDSHFYPVVKMSFTDVRGSSLMMPEEQYTYDKNSGVVADKDVCKNFFTSFFKFPYPRFLLSVKGFYGTCVTFILSVNDFKASFNSETGNFDVNVSFIGNMYGVFTDIPMNYLIAAPYINEGYNKGILNEYWQNKVNNGDFLYNESNNDGGGILTFMDFYGKYKDFVNKFEKSDELYGSSMVALGGIDEEIRYIKALMEKNSQIKNNIVSPDKIVSYTFNCSGRVAYFNVDDNNLDSDRFEFNAEFISEFSRIYNEAIKKVTVSNIMVPDENSPIYNIISNHTVIEGNGVLTQLELEEVKTLGENIQSQIEKSKHFIVFDSIFEDSLNKAKMERLEERATREKEASNEILSAFREHIGFTPTIENVMRMIFAHLDTFMHLFYTTVKNVSPERTLKSIGWDKKFTDIESPGESKNVFVPPFTAFYTKSGERFYPGRKEYGIENVNEIVEKNLVEGIFNGIESAIIGTNDNENNGGAEENTSVSSSFNPIAITDLFYNTNPYDTIETNDINFILYFFSCRLALAARGKGGKNDVNINYIIDKEFRNFKGSQAWTRFISDEQQRNRLNSLKGKITPSADRIFSRDFRGRNIKFFTKDADSVYYKFRGKDVLTSDNAETRGTIPSFSSPIIEKENGRKYNDSNIEAFRKRINLSGLEDKVAKKVLVNASVHSSDYNKITRSPIIELEYSKDNGAYSMPKSNKHEHDNITAIVNEYYTSTSITTEKLLNEKRNEQLWIPLIEIPGYDNIFYNFKGNILYDSGYTDYERVMYFLAALIRYCEILCDLEIDTDGNGNGGIFKVRKFFYYFIGGYDLLGKKAKEKIDDIIKDYNQPVINNEGEKEKLEKSFKAFAKKFKEIILDNLQSFNKNCKWIKTLYRHYIPPTEYREIQEFLIELLRDSCWIGVFPKYATKEEKESFKKDEAFIEFGKSTFIEKLDSFIKKIQDEVEAYNKVNEEESNSSVIENSNESVVTDDDTKTSLYYTLKNLYDRWLSSYTEDRFKLKSVSEEIESKRRKMRNDVPDKISEFDNFLYVDSFYNDISKKFFVNPASFFDIVDGQMKGNTNFNVFDFIARICEKNKLLLQCLPVYNNLYSVNTFEDIFTPMSLYSTDKNTKRREGNTYLLMYTYEPSHNLNLEQDKTNDVSFSNDSFDIADTFGTITDEAKEIFDGKGDMENYGINAFGVTPGAQNQSYFTRVSVGMDNPRVTDLSIMNTFRLAEASKGSGRAEGIGTGQDLYSIYSNRSYDCRVEMMGCANIMPMMYFQLNNVPMFKGAYMIKKVEHSIQNNSMTTTFIGTRMSKRYIPFNTSIFNVGNLIAFLGRTESGATYSVGAGNIKLTYDGEGNAVAITKNGVPAPSSDFDYTKKSFNIWAAVQQMNQCLYTSEAGENGRQFVPLTDGNPWYPDLNNMSIKKAKPVNAICATAVETFLMAGFNGVFCSKSAKDGIIVDKIRINNGYFGENGYNMCYKLAELGFKCILCGANALDEAIKDHEILIGDVCVMRHGQFGHVCMWSGKNWVSDFKQNRWWPYSGEKPVSPYDVLLYRYGGQTINEKAFAGYIENGAFKEGEPENFNEAPIE